MASDDSQILKLINEWFDANYERLRAESGHALAPDVKETARQHVLLYWKKLKHLAKSITETEVRLNLPDQKTKAGRVYCIEGVVDIIREQNRIAMYDIKTMEADDVRRDIKFYERQLNIYAHIWTKLHGQDLDEASIIATQFPESVKQILQGGDPHEISEALRKWNPIVKTNFDPERVRQTIRDFGSVVDAVEDNQFEPPNVRHLKKGDGRMIFATRVCRNCDARHSCKSYRAYAKRASRRSKIDLREFYEETDIIEETTERKEIALEEGGETEPIQYFD